MSEKPKGSEIDQQSAAEQGVRRQVPGTPAQRNQADAIEPSGEVNQEKLKKNQERLQVSGDHKTEDMKKGHRGTFP
jgi:hypothetical protein